MAMHRARSTSSLIRRRVELGGERVWRFEDFAGLPHAAVAQSLSRLSRTGEIERLSKGTYYRPRPRTFGRSSPNPVDLRAIALRRQTAFPSGIAAAYLLDLTTQDAARVEIATTARSLPRKLIGDDTIVHTRRPEAWSDLSQTEGALLDFLRRGGVASDLSAKDIERRVLSLLSERNTYQRLIRAVNSEPPRVRAILGALGERLGADGRTLGRLRKSLNPYSRFNFGALSGLPNARAWQARRRS